MLEQVQKLKDTIVASQSGVVVLTGAGISVPSGIPDFRGTNGVWSKYRPEDVASIKTFRKDPTLFWDFYMEHWHTLSSDFKPNNAHNVLRWMQHQGMVNGIITQNIDGLHQKAGSDPRDVFEVHGTTRTWSCMDQCQTTFPAHEVADMAVVRADGHRLCPACSGPTQSGRLKPDVVLFGENLPYDATSGAEKVMRDSDVMIVVGSSLTVSPVSEMPQRFSNDPRQQLVVIGPGRTKYSLVNDNLHIYESADDVFSMLYTMFKTEAA